VYLGFLVALWATTDYFSRYPKGWLRSALLGRVCRRALFLAAGSNAAMIGTASVAIGLFPRGQPQHSGRGVFLAITFLLFVAMTTERLCCC